MGSVRHALDDSAVVELAIMLYTTLGQAPIAAA
jgi:hypothetical protein